MSIVTQLKAALIKLGAETVSGDTIAAVLKTGLGSITGNALTGNTIATVLNSFNNNHVATVTFSTTPTGTTIVVKSGANVIAPYEDGNYYLEPGSYTYTASADGYVTKADQALIIIEDDVNTTKTVTVELVLVPEPVQLSTPHTLSYTEGTLSWTGDSNATRYELAKLVGGDYISMGSTADGTQSFPISTLELDAGTYNIAVMAIGDEPNFEEYTNSEWSTTIEILITE